MYGIRSGILLLFPAEAIISTVFAPMYKDRRQKSEIETKTVNVKEIQKNNNVIQLVVPFYCQTSSQTRKKKKQFEKKDLSQESFLYPESLGYPERFAASIVVRWLGSGRLFPIKSPDSVSLVGVKASSDLEHLGKS